MKLKINKDWITSRGSGTYLWVRTLVETRTVVQFVVITAVGSLVFRYTYNTVRHMSDTRLHKLINKIFLILYAVFISSACVNMLVNLNILECMEVKIFF